jgi:CRP-like cAMP-binding protein
LPIARNYKPGSIIYFEGDKNPSEIFILQKGKVVLSSTDIHTGEEYKESIAAGEFFGVKSVLGKYPREDTAQVSSQAIVLVLKPEEFEQMVMGNFRILMKMLKVFSNQLRRIGKQVREMMQQEEPKMPSTELFNIGEYYFRKGKVEQATYVYNKYIEVYPGEQFIPTAQERLDAIARGDLELPATVGAPSEPSYLNKMENAAPSVAEQIQQNISPENQEVDNRPDILKTSEGIDITKKFYEALSLTSQDKPNEALEIHKTIAGIMNYPDDQTAKFAEKSMLEMGKTYMVLEDFMEGIESFSRLIKKFGQTEYLKDALFHIGECYEKMEKNDKAMNFYQKVVNTPPKEEINQKAKEKIEELHKMLQ